MRRMGTMLVGAIIMALAVPAMAAPVSPVGTFTDDNNSVHEADIEAIATAGITRGCNPPTNDNYCPDDPVTRAQMASFLTRALGLTPITPTPPSGTFTDDDTNIHEADIEAIAAAGITRGCNPPTNDNYCPDDPVTRAQMASFLTRALGLTPITPTPPSGTFTDDDTNIHEADIEAIAAAGITRGCNPPTNDNYCPDDPVTRAQMASFLTRALGLTPMPPPSVSDAHLSRVFFFSPLAPPSTPDGPYLATVARYGESAATPDDLLDMLLDGPSASEVADGFSTNIPEGVVSNEPVAVAGGTATVDLSENFDDGGGSAAMLGRLAELTFTLTGLPTIEHVQLELDDVPVAVFSSEGILIPPGGLDREYFLPTETEEGPGVAPDIMPEAPAHGEAVESPIEVRGLSRTFEATVEWELLDAGGAVIAQGFETTGSGTATMLPMEIDIPYVTAGIQMGTLNLWWTSPADGAPARSDQRSVRVWLTP